MIPGQRISDEATNWPGPIAGQYGQCASGAWKVCTPEGVLVELAAAAVTEHMDGTISTATADLPATGLVASDDVAVQVDGPAAPTWKIERGTWKPQ